LDRQEPDRKLLKEKKGDEQKKLLVFSVIRNPSKPILADITIVEGTRMNGKISYSIPENSSQVSYRLGPHKTRRLTY